MGRFYRTSAANQIDFMRKLPENLMMGVIQNADKQIASNEAATLSLYDNLEANTFQEWTPKMDEIIQGFESRADELAKDIQSNPLEYRKTNPKIDKLARDIQKEWTRGEIGAMQGQYKDYQDWITKMAKDKDVSPDDLNKINSKILEGVTPESWKFDPVTNVSTKLDLPNIPKRVDRNKLLQEYMKDFVGNKYEGISFDDKGEMQFSAQWEKQGPYLYKNKHTKEFFNLQDVAKTASNFLNTQPDVAGYDQFMQSYLPEEWGSMKAGTNNLGEDLYFTVGPNNQLTTTFDPNQAVSKTSYLNNLAIQNEILRKSGQTIGFDQDIKDDYVHKEWLKNKYRKDLVDYQQYQLTNAMFTQGRETATVNSVAGGSIVASQNRVQEQEKVKEGVLNRLTDLLGKENAALLGTTFNTGPGGTAPNFSQIKKNADVLGIDADIINEAERQYNQANINIRLIETKQNEATSTGDADNYLQLTKSKTLPVDAAWDFEGMEDKELTKVRRDVSEYFDNPATWGEVKFYSSNEAIDGKSLNQLLQEGIIQTKITQEKRVDEVPIMGKKGWTITKPFRSKKQIGTKQVESFVDISSGDITNFEIDSKSIIPTINTMEDGSIAWQIPITIDNQAMSVYVSTTSVNHPQVQKYITDNMSRLKAADLWRKGQNEIQGEWTPMDGVIMDYSNNAIKIQDNTGQYQTYSIDNGITAISTLIKERQLKF